MDPARANVVLLQALADAQARATAAEARLVELQEVTTELRLERDNLRALAASATVDADAPHEPHEATQ